MSQSDDTITFKSNLTALHKAMAMVTTEAAIQDAREKTKLSVSQMAAGAHVEYSDHLQ
jgi:hypothetical protein